MTGAPSMAEVLARYWPEAGGQAAAAEFKRQQDAFPPDEPQAGSNPSI